MNDVCLPNDWTLSPLTQIAQIIRGVSYKKEDSSDTSKVGYMPLLRATNIQNGSIILDNDLVYAPIKVIKPEQYLQEGDIVVCMSSGSKHLVGKTGQVNKVWKGTFGTFCAVIRPDDKINKKFLGYYFSAPTYRNFISKQSAGININNLKPSDFDLLEIPIPTLEEQNQIVSKIEELFSQLDAGVAGLKRVQELLKQYRASVLKAAFEGRLVPQDPNDEPAIQISPNLPKGWKLEKVSKLITNISPNRRKVFKRDYLLQGKYPVIDQGQDYIGGYTNENLVVTEKLPVIVFGDHTKVIKFVNFPFVAGADGIKVLKPSDVFVPKLFFYFLQVLEIPNKGYARHFQYLCKSIIPIPPINEQKRIVHKIESVLSNIEYLEKTVENQLAHAERIRQSILNYAFTGRLLNLDNTYKSPGFSG